MDNLVDKLMNLRAKRFHEEYSKKVQESVRLEVQKVISIIQIEKLCNELKVIDGIPVRSRPLSPSHARLIDLNLSSDKAEIEIRESEPASSFLIASIRCAFDFEGNFVEFHLREHNLSMPCTLIAWDSDMKTFCDKVINFLA